MAYASAYVLYRNVVDVDILGVIDSPMKAYKENWVNCGV